MIMVPAKSFLVAGALATSGVMAGIMAIPRDDTILVETPSIAVVASDVLMNFEDSFRNATAAVALQTAAVERALPIPGIAPPVAKPEPAPTNVSSASVAEVDQKRSTRRGRHVDGRDVCARNHLRKKFIRHGKSWSCVK